MRSVRTVGAVGVLRVVGIAAVGVSGRCDPWREAGVVVSAVLVTLELLSADAGRRC